VLAHWGARSLGPPTSLDELEPGWLSGALRVALASDEFAGRVEFRIGDERAALMGGDVVRGAIDDPDAVISGDASAFYRLVVERDLDAVAIEGDVGAVRGLLATLPAPPSVVPA
jgi:hypothetical protein